MTNTTLTNPSIPTPIGTKPLPPTPNSSTSVDASIDVNTTSIDIPLFTDHLISPEVQAALPPGYTIRPLRRSDYHRGYLDVLRVLTTVGEVTDDKWNERYDWISTRNDEYYLLVVCDEADRIVGTGSLIVERKFIHSLGLVGHIEDIAVEKGQQGKKLGLRIIQALDYVAANVGCYKVGVPFFSFFSFFSFFIWAVLYTLCYMYTYANRLQSILDCSEANEGFYVKCGFKRAGLEMAHYY